MSATSADDRAKAHREALAAAARICRGRADEATRECCLRTAIMCAEEIAGYARAFSDTSAEPPDDEVAETDDPREVEE